MREIKFRITYQHDETGRLTTQIITLGEAIPDVGERWTIIGKDQYIEVHDKHHREIYEGDVVRADWHWETPHVITWPNDYYYLMEYGLGLDGDNLEVIGDMYANPELLSEGTKEQA